MLHLPHTGPPPLIDEQGPHHMGAANPLYTFFLSILYIYTYKRVHTCEANVHCVQIVFKNTFTYDENGH